MTATEGSEADRSFAMWFAVVAVALLWLQTSRVDDLLHQVDTLRGEEVILKATLDVAEWEEQALLEAMMLNRGTAPALIASDENGLVQETELGDRIVYLLATSCGKCPQNFPWLTALERASPGSVIGISLTDDPSVLSRYASRYGIPFPVVRLTGGWLHAMVPRHATPVTLLLRDGMVRRVETGAVTDDVARAIALEVARPYRRSD